MKKWGYAMKVPVGRHVNEAGKKRIHQFQRKAKKLESRTV